MSGKNHLLTQLGLPEDAFADEVPIPRIKQAIRKAYAIITNSTRRTMTSVTRAGLQANATNGVTSSRNTPDQRLVSSQINQGITQDLLKIFSIGSPRSEYLATIMERLRSASDTNGDDSNHHDLVEMGPTDLLTALELSESSTSTHEDSFLHVANLLNIAISDLDGPGIVQALNARVVKCKQMFNHTITDFQKRAFLHLAAKTAPHLADIQAVITAQTAIQLGKCQHLEGYIYQMMHKETVGQGLEIFTKESFSGFESFTEDENVNVLTIAGQVKLFGTGRHLIVDTNLNQIKYVSITSNDRELQLDMCADSICNVPSKWSAETKSFVGNVHRLNVAFDKNIDLQKKSILASIQSNTTVSGALDLKFYLNVFTTIPIEVPKDTVNTTTSIQSYQDATRAQVDHDNSQVDQRGSGHGAYKGNGGKGKQKLNAKRKFAGLTPTGPQCPDCFFVGGQYHRNDGTTSNIVHRLPCRNAALRKEIEACLIAQGVDTSGKSFFFGQGRKFGNGDLRGIAEKWKAKEFPIQSKTAKSASAATASSASSSSSSSSSSTPVATSSRTVCATSDLNGANQWSNLSQDQRDAIMQQFSDPDAAESDAESGGESKMKCFPKG